MLSVKVRNELTDKRREERIAIVKDALKWLKSDRIIADAATHLQIDYGKKIPEEDCQFNEIFKNSTTKCNVCAKGLLFFSHVMSNNHLTVKEIHNVFIGNAIYERLPMFTPEQIDLIELAFEGMSFNWNKTEFNTREHSRQIYNALTIFHTHTRPHNRLKAILERMLNDCNCELYL